MRPRLWTAAAVLAMSASSAMPALAQEGRSAAMPHVLTVSDTAQSDAALAHRIAERVRRYINYTRFDDVNLSVNNGLVTLSGRVTQPYKAKDLVRIVSRVNGVLEVNNELGVLPVSIHDDRLRSSLARQIYAIRCFPVTPFTSIRRFTSSSNEGRSRSPAP